MDTLKHNVRALAIACNILFILWILYNGVQEDFQGTLPEKISYIGLICLLLANTGLLLGRKQSS